MGINPVKNLQLKNSDLKIIAWSYFKLHREFDEKTALHQLRVAYLARDVAKQITTNEKVIENIFYAGLLHDLGKMFVPVSILKTNNSLTENEMEIIKEHPQRAAELLKKLDINNIIIRAVKQHHERLDGSGYPDGLCNKKISMEGKIIAVCDVYDAMSSPRPYRQKPLLRDVVFKKMEDKKRTLYDLNLINILEGIVKDSKKIS